jgi:hypothetical protein
MPLPEPTARALLDSKVWRTPLDRAEQEELPASPDFIAAVVALVPSSLRAALRADLAPGPSDLTARALKAMSLLDAIETA